jgi:fumarylacetoacetase
MQTWLEIPQNSDFSIHNIPFGVCRVGKRTMICSRIADYVIDLEKMQELNFFWGIDIPADVFRSEYLNNFIALGKPVTNAIRQRIQEVFKSENTFRAAKSPEDILIDIKHVKMQMPVKCGDYTDFYSSIEHATNVGIMFRDPANALLPNWRHIPVGYHGRASSIVVSGTPVKRPKGQTKADDATMPTYGPTRLMDFELEMGFIVGKANELGNPVPVDQAEDHIFGMVLFNDWSARDIQKWEYVPLGPFLGKSFCSSMSPWVVTMEALDPFRVEGPMQEPEVLDYLKIDGKRNFDIQLEVFIKPPTGGSTRVSLSNFKFMYWNMNQQLAHHTVNGCNMNIGDICASGTISGRDPGSYGSMLEISWKGTKPVKMHDDTERKFIQDNDTVVMKGFAEKDGVRVGFGEVSGKVLPTE